MSHTPGPWVLHPPFVVWAPEAKAVIAAASDLRATDEVRYSPVSLSSPDFHEAACNARLLAAAPELLDALKRIVGYDDGPLHSGSRDNYEWYGRSPRVWEAAKAAIAKAEGR